MSVVFDRATSFYGQTRGLLEAIEDWLTDSVLNEVGLVSGSRVLEIGVGTGRIARHLRVSVTAILALIYPMA